MGEKSVGYELVRESPWDQRDEFLSMNPTGRTPVMKHTERDILLIDSVAICEYIEETVDKAPMINGKAVNRAEIRRLVALFDEQFYGDVTAHMMHERMHKRLDRPEPQDTKIMSEAIRRANVHPDFNK